jgi:hypothetical protein
MFVCVRFKVDNQTGVLSTADAKLDRETKDTYQIYLVAQDGGGRRTGVPVTVTVTDQNDKRPVFRDSAYSARVRENTLVLDPPVVVLVWFSIC